MESICHGEVRSHAYNRYEFRALSSSKHLRQLRHDANPKPTTMTTVSPLPLPTLSPNLSFVPFLPTHKAFFHYNTISTIVDMS